jgi:broad specificity phosphatase PhoE
VPLRLPPTSPEVPHLLLVRHGRTVWNLERRGQGQADIPLDEVGRTQAAAAGDAIAALRPSLVWSSDSSRAHDTALATGLPVHTDSRLREIDLGAYEGKLLAEWEAAEPDEYARNLAGHDVRRGGGELNSEVGARALPALQDALALTPADGLLVVVSHGGTIRALLRLLLELPPSPWSHLGALDNTCCALLEHDEHGRGWRLERFGVLAATLRPHDLA